jgi:hypothetical protein
VLDEKQPGQWVAGRKTLSGFVQTEPYSPQASSIAASVYLGGVGDLLGFPSEKKAASLRPFVSNLSLPTRREEEWI